MGEAAMRRVPFRAFTALVLTAVGLLASACTVYEGGPRYGHGGYGFRDDDRHERHHDWR